MSFSDQFLPLKWGNDRSCCEDPVSWSVTSALSKHLIHVSYRNDNLISLRFTFFLLGFLWVGWGDYENNNENSYCWPCAERWPGAQACSKPLMCITSPRRPPGPLWWAPWGAWGSRGMEGRQSRAQKQWLSWDWNPGSPAPWPSLPTDCRHLLTLGWRKGALGPRPGRRRPQLCVPFCPQLPPALLKKLPVKIVKIIMSSIIFDYFLGFVAPSARGLFLPFYFILDLSLLVWNHVF